MTKRHYNHAIFLTSAAKLSQLPPDEGMEVAFAGRSNVGKSSLINALTDNKKLAKTSKTPGRTQLINLFTLDDTRRLVDLPGYGYAKVSKAMKDQWNANLSAYLEERNCLQGLVLIMDIRHPLKEFDQWMLEWCHNSQLPTHIVLNKSDKLKRGAAKTALLQVKQALKNFDQVSLQLFSCHTKDGFDQLQQRLDQWFFEAE